MWKVFGFCEHGRRFESLDEWMRIKNWIPEYLLEYLPG